LDLPGRVEFDTGLYYVDSLRNREIPPYLRADARIGWRARRGLEFSVQGENLSGRHAEFWSDVLGMPDPVEFGRTVNVRVGWRFD
jgi:outer membrane receptor protein involved in Fe transport